MDKILLLQQMLWPFVNGEVQVYLGLAE